jgi:hypothetical protein
MKTIRVIIDFDVEYDDTEPGAFERAMIIVNELLDIEVDLDTVRVVQSRSYS